MAGEIRSVSLLCFARLSALLAETKIEPLIVTFVTI